MNIEVGRGWRTLRLGSYRSHWPTIMGENPPRGIPYRAFEASYGGRSVQVRLWNWRRKQPTSTTASPARVPEPDVPA